MSGILAQLVSRIPGQDAYEEQVSLNGQRTSQGIQQQGALMQMMAQMEGRQAKQQTLQREAKMREVVSRLPADATPDQIAAAVRPFASADDVLKAATSSADRRVTAAATKEAAIARLTQQAQQFDQNYQIRLRQATTAEERANVEAQYKQARLALDNAALRMTGERLHYDTGARVAVPQVGITPAQPAPMAAPQPMVQGEAPNQAAAVAAINAGGGRPMTLEIPAGAPAPAQTAMPDSGAPIAPTPLAPAPPNNMDARDLRMQAGAPAASPVAAPVASAEPASPQMPAFVGSPREQAAAKNKWLAAQTKGGEGGGKASEAVVTAIKEGRMQMPTGFALRSPYWQDVIERVAKEDPTFDASRYTARSAARRTFASGPEARNVTALNTVIGHLGTLDEAATALGNGDLRLFNSVANRLATETGDPRVQNFDTAKQAVAEETMRVFRQVGASESEARMWGERITASGSPKQLKGVIATLGELLDSRVEAIGQQYERTVNGDGNPARVDPKNRKTLDRLIGGAAPSSGFSDGEKERRYQEWKARQK
jgi:hypothetical protein